MNLSLYLFIVLPVLTAVRPFLLIGTWRPAEKSNTNVFEIRSNRFLLHDHDRTISITPVSWTSHPNRTITIGMENPTVDRPPPDWYNVVKYSRYIRYYRIAQKEGVRADIDVVDIDRIVVKARIGREELPSFELTRRAVD